MEVVCGEAVVATANVRAAALTVVVAVVLAVQALALALAVVTLQVRAGVAIVVGCLVRVMALEAEGRMEADELAVQGMAREVMWEEGGVEVALWVAAVLTTEVDGMVVATQVAVVKANLMVVVVVVVQRVVMVALQEMAMRTQVSCRSLHIHSMPRHKRNARTCYSGEQYTPSHSVPHRR